MTQPDEPRWMDDAATARLRDALRSGFGPDAAPDPADPPMPDEVAKRLHARLAIETAAPGADGDAEVTTLPLGMKARWKPATWMQVAAGFVVIGGGAALAIGFSGGGHKDHSAVEATAAAPSLDTGKAKSLKLGKITTSGDVLANEGALDAHVRALLGDTSAFSADSAASQAAGAVAGTTGGTATGSSSGTTGGSGDTVAGASTDAAKVPAPAAPATPSVTLHLTKDIPGGLVSCIAKLDSTRTPLAVDEAVYEGKDALVVVFPGDTSKEVVVYVVGSACDAAPPDGIITTRFIAK